MSTERERERRVVAGLGRPWKMDFVLHRRLLRFVQMKEKDAWEWVDQTREVVDTSGK